MISTVAGTGQCGTTNDGGMATAASITRPHSLAVDSQQNIYAGFNGVVRRISLGGIITTVAGGQGSLAGLGNINGIAVDAAGVVYLADTDNNVIRKVTPDGVITTIAGTGVAGNDGDGGAALLAQLNAPANLALDNAGNLYFADTQNSRVRVIKTDGTIATFAGNGKTGVTGDGGAATAAELSSPIGVAVDKAGNVFIGDAVGVVREVTVDGVIHTIAGAGADPSNAGFSGDGGPALSAQFNGLGSVVLDPTGNVYLVDRQNERVRVLTPISR
jgi:sugar lactone lactonase YvrE